MFMCFFLIFSIITILYLLTVYILIRTNRTRSSDINRLTEELSNSRRTVRAISDEVDKCRNILQENDTGLTGVIQRLREIGERVKVLEDICKNNCSS